MNSYQEFEQAYRIGERIGGGGYGTVSKAIDKRTGKTVAIKRGEVSEHKYTVKREVETAKKVGRHPNLIEYYGVYRFTENMGMECDYAVMEYCNGGTFDDFIKGKPDRKQIEQMFDGILNGLGHLHQQGVIHRDIKPGNIVWHSENGNVTPKLIDFGISKDIAADVSYSSHLVGTAAYMAPEQLNYGAVCNGTDLWALGVMLHQLFTGKHPYATDAAEANLADRLIRNINKGLWSGNLPNYIDKIPQPYREVVYKTLIKDTSERARSVQELKGITSGVILVNSTIAPRTEPSARPQPRPISQDDHRPTHIDLKPYPRPEPKPIPVEGELVPPYPRPDPRPSVPTYEKAGSGKRFVALLLDILLMGIFGVVLIGMYSFIKSELLPRSENGYPLYRSDLEAIIMFVCILAVLFRNSLGKNGSFGKQAMGLSIIDFKSQKPASIWKKLGREIIFLLFTVLDTLNYFVNEDNRSLGDLAAGTQVVELKK